jgi:predicted outer membrane repeat protein
VHISTELNQNVDILTVAGQIMSDFHLCQFGASSNTMACMNNEVLQSSLSFKKAIENLNQGDVLALKSGLYGGSTSCDVMINASSVIIRGSQGPERTIIDCNFHSRHLTIFGNNVSIMNIHFVRGSSDKSKVHSSHGGCILALGTATVVSDSTFVDCHAEAGGAVFALQGTGLLNMHNVTISSSSALLGAGVFSHGSINLKNCGFYSNRANLSGGAIHIFNNLKTASSQNSHLQLTYKNTFSNNIAPFGGAIYVDGGILGTMVLISDTAIFTENHANASQFSSTGDFCTWCQGKGGGIYAINMATVLISGRASLKSNLALQGGGIYLDKASNLDISGACEFTTNIASIGGAIFVGDYSTLSISGMAIFLRNEAIIYGPGNICELCKSYGGSVYAGYLNVSVNVTGNVNFSGNAADFGGALYSEGYGVLITIAGKSSFLSNTAVSGGAIFMKMDQAFTATILDEVHLIDNHVTDSGGGVYATGCGDANMGCFLHIDDQVAFFENRASGWGGAIRATGSISVVIKGTVQFMRNRADIGGAISMDGSVSKSSSTILDIAEQTIFSRNVANIKGGALHSEAGASVVIAGNVLFSDNYALLKGGGLIVERKSRLRISENVKLMSNSAGESGGAIFVHDSSVITLSNQCCVVGNQAENGGGISAEQFSNLTLSGYLNFTNNRALGNGGALHLTFGSHVWISNRTLFSRNTAVGDGGGMFAEISSSINIFGSELSLDSNFARGFGGAIFAREHSSVDVKRASLRGNSADNGGAVAVSFSSTLQVNYTEFLNNSALNMGGAIHASMASFLFIGSESILSGNKALSGGCIVTR